MGIIEKYRQEYHQKSVERKVKCKEYEANFMFQIAEYEGQLWLVFNGSNVCPCDMLKDTPVEAVKKMRELYIKHNTK